MTEHPFKEYHADATIGNLMWRIDHRTDAAFFSQDGTQILELERLIAEDRAELAVLLADYNEMKRLPPDFEAAIFDNLDELYEE